MYVQNSDSFGVRGLVRSVRDAADLRGSGWLGRFQKLSVRQLFIIRRRIGREMAAKRRTEIPYPIVMRTICPSGFGRVVATTRRQPRWVVTSAVCVKNYDFEGGGVIFQATYKPSGREDACLCI